MINTLRINKFREDVAVRITIFADGLGTWSSVSNTNMFIAPIRKSRTDLSNIPAMRASVSSWVRINDNSMPPRIKLGANYINGRYAHLQARSDGYDLPIFLGADGKVSEGAGACIFMLRKGCLVTPPGTSSVLESITRDTVITLARECGITVFERNIDRTELYVADELFLCGSAAEITPIVSVDGYDLGNGAPGPVTVSLLSTYLSVTSGESTSHSGWRTVLDLRI